jgi:putative transposase
MIGWTATTAGISDEMIRDMVAHCVEWRFGTVPAPHRVQWLSENMARSSPRIDFALALNFEPCLAPVEQWHGRGLSSKSSSATYVRVNPIPDAATPLAQIDLRMRDYNTTHPHSRLGYRSPREYINAQFQPAACPV